MRSRPCPNVLHEFRKRKTVDVYPTSRIARPPSSFSFAFGMGTVPVFATACDSNDSYTLMPKTTA